MDSDILKNKGGTMEEKIYYGIMLRMNDEHSTLLTSAYDQRLFTSEKDARKFMETDEFLSDCLNDQYSDYEIDVIELMVTEGDFNDDN